MNRRGFGVRALPGLVAVAMLCGCSGAPVQLCLWDPVQLYDSETDVNGVRLTLGEGCNRRVSGLDLGLVRSGYHQLNGLQVTGLFSGPVEPEDDDGCANGVQVAGAWNLGPDRLRGVQIAGLGNSAGDVDGVQAGGLFVSSAGGYLNGLQVGGICMTGKRVRGVQIGIVWNFCSCDNAYLWVDQPPWSSPMVGAQVALLGNWADESYGLQVAVLHNGAHAVNGIQAALLYDRTDELRGAQIGGICWAGQLAGAQIGGVGMADSVSGAQVGVLANICDGAAIDGRSMSGVQLGLGNYAEEHRGLQIALVNYAKHGRGVQIGLINIAPDQTIPFLPFVHPGLWPKK